MADETTEGGMKMTTLNRGIAGAVVPVLARLPLTPNQVTLLGLAAGLLAAWHFQEGASGWLSGALWLELSFILDNCDGALARRQGRFSGFGSWLDTISDCIVNMAFFYALGAGLSRDYQEALWLRVGLLTAVGVFFSYAMSFAAQVHRRGAEAWRHPDPPAGGPPDSRLVALRKRAREDFSWVVLAAALAEHMAWLLGCGLLSSFAIGVAALRSILRDVPLATALRRAPARVATVEEEAQLST
jgi:phosphatidylglycerophosphate synthase